MKVYDLASRQWVDTASPEPERVPQARTPIVSGRVVAKVVLYWIEAPDGGENVVLEQSGTVDDKALATRLRLLAEALWKGP